MTPNYVLPTNLILEMIILSGHSYGLGNSRDGASWQTDVDETCAGVIAVFLVLNVIWMIYFRSKGREFTIKCLATRAFQGAIMIVVGVMLIVVAISIRNSNSCDNGSLCDKFETRIIIAVLVLVDSILYFLNPVRVTIPQRSRMTTVLHPPTDCPVQGEYGASHPYFIEPPPSYFQLDNVNESNMPPPPPYGSVVSNNIDSSSTPSPSPLSTLPEYSVEPIDFSDDNNNIILPNQNQFQMPHQNYSQTTVI